MKIEINRQDYDGSTIERHLDRGTVPIDQTTAACAYNATLEDGGTALRTCFDKGPTPDTALSQMVTGGVAKRTTLWESGSTSGQAVAEPVKKEPVIIADPIKSLVAPE